MQGEDDGWRVAHLIQLGFEGMLKVKCASVLRQPDAHELRMGESKGYCFLTFSTLEEAKAVRGDGTLWGLSLGLFWNEHVCCEPGTS